MNRTKFMGIILGLIGVILLGGGIYLAISYIGNILDAVVDFITRNSGAISQCGITLPDKIVQLKDEIATTILPGVYLGIPLAVIVISVVMFAGGYFFGRGSYQDQLNSEKKREEEMEHEVERRLLRTKQRPKKEVE